MATAAARRAGSCARLDPGHALGGRQPAAAGVLPGQAQRGVSAPLCLDLLGAAAWLGGLGVACCRAAGRLSYLDKPTVERAPCWAGLGWESGVQRRLLAAGGWAAPAPSVLRQQTRPLCRLLPAPRCCSRADRASLCLPQRPPRSVWDVRSGGVVRSLESGGAVTSIEVTPCGRFLVTADGKQVGWAGQLPALPSRSGCVPGLACGGMHHGRVRARRSRLHHPSAPFPPLCTHAHRPARSTSGTRPALSW